MCAENFCVFTFGVFHPHPIFFYFSCIHNSCVSQSFFPSPCSYKLSQKFSSLYYSLHRYTFYICILCRLFFFNDYDDDDVYNIRLIANIPGVSSISIRRRHTYPSTYVRMCKQKYCTEANLIKERREEKKRKKGTSSLIYIPFFLVSYALIRNELK